MRTRRLSATLLLLVIPVAVPSVAQSPVAVEPAAEPLRLHENLPRDPMMVLGIRLEHPEDAFHRLLAAVGRFSPPTFDDGAAVAVGAIDPGLAEVLYAELLPRIDSEVVLSIDFPPLDEVVSVLQYAEGEALSSFLGRVGLLARVRDPEGVDRALSRMIGEFGGEIVSRDQLVESALPVGIVAADGSSPGAPRLSLFHALRDDRLALGFSRDWVLAALGPRPAGERLIDGEDFARVFAHLDPQPSELTYLNLPRLHAYINESQVARMVIEANADFRDFVTRFMTRETMSVGMGSTTVVRDRGVRTANFGPPWLSGTAVSSGFLAAAALPNLLVALDRGKTQRTMVDIQAIARACEGFSADSQGYPGPTRGWVPVEKIATFLEPVYIERLPLTDGWENPILYWSDIGSYRILSTGRDGRVDRDWTRNLEPVVAAGQDADIVFGDGKLIAGPEKSGSE